MVPRYTALEFFALLLFIADCEATPDAPENGVLVGVNMDADGAGTYSVGAVATYGCNSGYLPQGDFTIECTGTADAAMWETVTYTCIQGNVFHYSKW